MNKLILSLIALSALSGVAVASDRNDSSGAWRNAFDMAKTATMTSDTKALVIAAKPMDKAMTPASYGVEEGSDNN
jgi:hypothetical protein